MTGIVGIVDSSRHEEVNCMLNEISHRGSDGQAILEFDKATFGVVWTNAKENPIIDVTEQRIIQDFASNGQFAYVKISDGDLVLKRDQLGATPLYYGQTGDDGSLCFASEVKALLKVTNEVYELPPGHFFDGTNLESYFQLYKKPSINASAGYIAKELNRKLDEAVLKRLNGENVVGAWLSGGLDSSLIAALARQHVEKLHTFAIGLKNASDLLHAREVAKFIQADHHETLVNLADLLSVLPEVIYHLESFDALLVRSSITNYLVAKEASKYISTVFSGEGGDELFAGYMYLKTLERNTLSNELIDITNRLHNTALQRVDRCASAHGTVAHVPFLDPKVVEYAFRIPIEFKLKGETEKWILRKAMEGKLPESVLWRPKAKFWKGAGVGDLLARHAEKYISDSEFKKERTISNGWVLNTKEELMYYLLFREHFGELEDLSWMGRTKGAPTT